MDFFAEPASLFGIIVLIVLFVLGSTYLLKRFRSVESHIIYSLWRSERFASAIKRLYFMGHIIDFFAITGAILGFGVLASDFLFAKERKLFVRLALAAIVSLILALFYFFTFRALVLGTNFTRSYDVIFFLFFSVFGMSFFGFILMLVNGIHILQGLFTGSTVCPGVAPLIPGVRIPKVPVFIPWYGWIALLIAMLLHECAHGIQALKSKLKLKSAGVLLVGLLPFGAFVEPDEEQLKKADPKMRIKIYCAGPSANLFSVPFFLIIALLFNTYFVTPIYEKYQKSYLENVQSVEVSNVFETIPYCNSPKSPAHGILEPGMQIVAIDGNRIKNRLELYSILSSERFKERAFTIIDKNKEAVVVLKPNQELPLNPPENFGFTVKDILKENAKIDSDARQALMNLSIIENFLWLCFLLSFLVMLFNFLPIVPLDGGYVASDLYSHYFFGEINEKNRKIVADVLLAAFFIIALLNILPFFV
ncbi:MAG: site-2 protease family protein [Candidatus Diapherotrites archaeon]|nr:site-2 protease family protein [Candidatus Diapherotrites archaeon]